jgi:hypothetical protein
MYCSICGKKILGDEHNALPVSPRPCCTKCNENVVIPIRIYNLGSNKEEGLLLKPDFSVRIISPKQEKFSLEELQDLVEGYIEYYPTNNKKIKIIVNEEGLLKRLPLNKLGNIYGIHAVGNVVIIPNNLV